MKNQRQVIFKKNGSSEWKELGPIRTLEQFNSDFWDWVERYYEDCEQQGCQNWEDALEVLNTVGASAMAGKFDLLLAKVVEQKQKSLEGLDEFEKCAVYNSYGDYVGLFDLDVFSDYEEENFETWAEAEKYAREEGYTLVPVL